MYMLMKTTKTEASVVDFQYAFYFLVVGAAIWASSWAGIGEFPSASLWVFLSIHICELN